EYRTGGFIGRQSTHSGRPSIERRSVRYQVPFVRSDRHSDAGRRNFRRTESLFKKLGIRAAVDPCNQRRGNIRRKRQRFRSRDACGDLRPISASVAHFGIADRREKHLAFVTSARKQNDLVGYRVTEFIVCASVPKKACVRIAAVQV